MIPNRFSFLSGQLICPNCGINLDIRPLKSKDFFNLTKLFENEVVHSGGRRSKEKWKTGCSNCFFPVIRSRNWKNYRLKFEFNYDYLLAKNDKNKWLTWKSVQLDGWKIGNLDLDASYSSSKNLMSRDFGMFIESNIDINKSRILDLGVGVLRSPTYLKNIPTRNIIGLDIFDTNFRGNVVICASEFLPLADCIFDVAVFASTIDHVFDWKRSLEEAARVLKADGVMFFWNHFRSLANTYRGTRGSEAWFRVWETGLVQRLNSEFEDPFHSREVLNPEFSVIFKKFMETLGFKEIGSSHDGDFSCWSR